ncbi:protein-methionine-sulfoxide reductase heme-binding subunit MsrQ [Algicella marina]|uniref:Protein-methionine-sulfoxide reductase heme-binding subunit MsrQ n=1 Tax=Algicella marina TaxID=2683284 RepID=A0A6P1T2Y1_9RHOB|nr:protein-methionine-sulfoxide reductase heme-binding subunit MsrQ [Algicella marina]QHQ36101.1 protein-methionine-sulfoxide reductase heme-binding subunit MsrQ [Algicella marina]
MEAVRSLNGWLRKPPVWPFYILAAVPFGWYVWLAATNGLGPDPVKTLEHGLGKLGLQFLVASLCVTPLLRITRINLMRFRRMLGLACFAYVALHFAVYLFLDLQLDWGALAKDLTKRPYIIAGTSAFLLLVPLAVTSNGWSVRRLGGAAWAKLHRLVYPAAVLAALHYIWLVKAWPLEPMVYGVGIAILLASRGLRNIRNPQRVARAS